MRISFARVGTSAIIVFAVAALAMGLSVEGDKTILKDDFTGTNGNSPDTSNWKVTTDTGDTVKIKDNTLECAVSGGGRANVEMKTQFSPNNFSLMLDFNLIVKTARTIDVTVFTWINGTKTEMLTIYFYYPEYRLSYTYRSSGSLKTVYTWTDLSNSTWYTLNLTVSYDEFSFTVKETSTGTTKASRTSISIDALQSTNSIRIGAYGPYSSSKPKCQFDNFVLRGEGGPNTPVIASPVSGSQVNTTPVLRWNYSHSIPSEAQAKFQLQIGKSSNLASPTVDTGIVNSSDTYYFPTTLTTGMWYWRVRVADSEDLWSTWSSVANFVLDNAGPVLTQPQDEGDWTNSSTLKWTWTEPSDPSGISGYYVCIGTSPGATDIVRDAWTIIRMYAITGAENGKTYYCKARAKDGAGNLGPYSPSSDGITIDLDPPIAGKPLDDPRYTNQTTLGWRWTAFDLGSGLSGYHVKVGTTPGGGDIVSSAWTTKASYATTVTTVNTVYYCSVRPKDLAGNLGSWSAPSLGAVVDTVPPSDVVVTDAGTYNNNGTLVFTWTAATDNLAGIAGYIIDIGTSLNGTDVANGTFVAATWFEYPYGMNATTYFARVRAVDLAGNVGNYSVSTDGITVDLKGPPANRVVDEGMWCNSSALVFTWLASVDPVSGITGYYIHIGSSPGTADVIGGLLIMHATFTFKGVIDGRTYYAWVVAVDGAGNQGAPGPASDGITVDITAPTVSTPSDGGLWSTTPMLTWRWAPSVDLTSGVMGYRLRIGTLTGAANVVPDAMVTGTSFSISTGVDGFTYYCQVQAMDHAGNHAPWSASSDGITVDLTAPMASTPNDGGTWTKLTHINFTWAAVTDAVSGLARYELRVGTAPGSDNVLGVTGTGNEWYDLAGVSEGVTYYAQLRAVDTAGNVGLWSASTDGITVDLTAPGIVSVEDEGKWCSASWTTWSWTDAAETISGVARYLVDIGTSAGSADVVAGAEVSSTRYTLSGLSDGKTYYCCVQAQDSAGNLGAWSNWTDGITVDLTAPTASTVSDKGAYSTTSTVTFNWTGSSDVTSGVAGYRVYIGTALDSDDVVSGVYTSGTSYTFSGGRDGLSYYCRVQAIDGAGLVGLMSTSSDGIYVDTVAPLCSTPVDAGRWHTGGDLTFTWAAATEAHSGVSGYLVTVGTTPGGSEVADGEWTTSTEHTVGDPVEGQTYYCRIRAKDLAGNTGALSTISDGVTVDTVAPPTPVVRDTDRWSISSTLVFHWSPVADATSGLAGYEVRIGTFPGDSSIVSDAWAVATEYAFAHAIDGAKYFTGVRAVDAAGNRGPWDDTHGGVTVDLTPPTAVHVTDSGEWSRHTWLTFEWEAATDPTSGVDHYLVDVGTAQGAADVVSSQMALGMGFTLFQTLEGTGYFCTVRAVDMAGNVGEAGEPSDGIVVDLTPPTVRPPVTLSRWSTDGDANWSWPPASDPVSGLASYTVSVGSVPGGEDVVSAQVLAPSEHSFNLTGLEEGTYHLTLAAVDGAGNTAVAPGTHSVVTVDAHVDAVAHARDEGVWSADPVLEFEWAPVDDPVSGLDGYRVYLGTTPDGSDVVDGQLVNGPLFVWTEGQDGTTYYLRVAAVDMAGNVASLSPPTGGVTVDLTPPGPVPVRDGGRWSRSTRIVFEWNPPPEDGLVTLTFVAIGTAPGVAIHTATLSGLVQGYVFSDALPDTNYHCWVWFEDGAGNVGLPGEPSDGITVDTTPPSAVTVYATGPCVPPGPLDLSWSEALDALSGVAGYDVAVGTDPGFQNESRVPSSPRTLTVPGVEAGSLYLCRVRAVDAAGNPGPWCELPEGVLVHAGFPPVRLVVAGGAPSTASAIVTLQVLVDEGVTAREMRVSEDASFEDVMWEPFSGSLVFMLGAAEGEHEVHVQVRNNLGVIGTASATVELDTTPPEITFHTEDGATTDNERYAVRGQVEPGSRVTYRGKELLVESDGSFSLSIPLVEGANAIDMVAEDDLGNSASAGLTLYREPSTFWSSLSAAFAILAFAAVVLLILMFYLLLIKRGTTVTWEEFESEVG